MSGSFWRTSFHRECTRAKDKVPMREVEDRNGRGYGTRSLWSLTVLLKSSPGHTGRASWGQPSKEWTGKKTVWVYCSNSVFRVPFRYKHKTVPVEEGGRNSTHQGPLKKKSNRQIHLLPSQGGKFFFFWVNEVTDISCFANLSCCYLKDNVVECQETETEDVGESTTTAPSSCTSLWLSDIQSLKEQ